MFTTSKWHVCDLQVACLRPPNDVLTPSKWHVYASQMACLDVVIPILFSEVSDLVIPLPRLPLTGAEQLPLIAITLHIRDDKNPSP